MRRIRLRVQMMVTGRECSAALSAAKIAIRPAVRLELVGISMLVQEKAFGPKGDLTEFCEHMLRHAIIIHVQRELWQT
jgi:hypothetical protein